MVVQLPLSPLSVVFLAAGAALLAVAGVTVWRGTDTRVTEWFLALLVADAVWAFTSVLPLEAATPRMAFFGEVTRLGGSVGAVFAWFTFAMVYTGRGSMLTRTRAVVIATPLTAHVVAFATNTVHGLSVSQLAIRVERETTLVTYEFDVFYALGLTYALSLVIAGTALVVETAITDRELYADQSAALLVGSMMPIAGAAVTAAGMLDAGATNLTPATLTVTAVCYAYALFRTDLLTAGPIFATEGRQVAVEALDEGFLIADGTDRVVDANPAARSLLDADQLVGRSLHGLVPVTENGDGPTTVETDDGRVLEAVVVSAADGSNVGCVVTLRDVTERERRRERVQVLNRVLRHNLRNDLNVVRGFARRIVDHETGPRMDGAGHRENTAGGTPDAVSSDDATTLNPRGDESAETTIDGDESAETTIDGDASAETTSNDGSTEDGADDASAETASRDEQTDATTFDTVNAAKRIVDQTDALLTVAEHARTLEEVIDAAGTPTIERVDLRAVVADALATTPGTDRAVVEARLPDEPIRANEAMVSVVIEELVDNAIRHNDRPNPTVRITAECDEQVVIRVADDGPGVPDQERAAVESGTESALEHGSRLGLWMVRWGVQTLGGTLQIRDREPTGTVVEIRLPADPEA